MLTFMYKMNTFGPTQNIFQLNSSLLTYVKKRRDVKRTGEMTSITKIENSRCTYKFNSCYLINIFI